MRLRMKSGASATFRATVQISRTGSRSATPSTCVSSPTPRTAKKAFSQTSLCVRRKHSMYFLSARVDRGACVFLAEAGRAGRCRRPATRTKAPLCAPGICCSWLPPPLELDKEPLDLARPCLIRVLSSSCLSSRAKKFFAATPRAPSCASRCASRCASVVAARSASPLRRSRRRGAIIETTLNRRAPPRRARLLPKLVCRCAAIEARDADCHPAPRGRRTDLGASRARSDLHSAAALFARLRFGAVLPAISRMAHSAWLRLAACLLLRIRCGATQ